MNSGEQHHYLAGVGYVGLALLGTEMNGTEDQRENSHASGKGRLQDAELEAAAQ